MQRLGFFENLRQEEIEFSNRAGEAEAISIRAVATRQIYLQDRDGNRIEVNSTVSD